jgi:phosphate transport system substrate-binding protein
MAQGTIRGAIVRFGGLALLMASVAAVAIMWRGGGLDFGQTTASAEECNARISGALVMSRRLAPDLVAGFLRESGYEVEAPRLQENGDVHIAGRRAGTQCTIVVHGATSTQGFAELSSGQSLIAMSLRPINESEVAMMSAAGAGNFAADQSEAQHLVALDALAFAVPTGSGLREISIDNARDIYTGAILDWSEIGGPAAPIHLHLPRDGNSADDFPNDLIPVAHPELHKLEQRTTLHDTDLEAAAALRGDRLSAGIFSAAFAAATSGVRTIELGVGEHATLPTADNVESHTYPLVRRLYFYVRPQDMRSNAFVRGLIAYIESAAAREPIVAAGFVPVPHLLSDAGQGGGDAHTCIYGTAESAAVTSAVRGARRAGAPLRFEPGTLRLDDESIGRVALLAPEARAEISRGGALVLVGHADAEGESAENRDLGMRRAFAARDAFEQEGVFGMITVSAGEMCWSAENVTPEGRRDNQRVEIWIRSGDQGAPR